MMKEWLMWMVRGVERETSADALLLGTRKEMIYGAFVLRLRKELTSALARALCMI
jgi:hypothetical protein